MTEEEYEMPEKAIREKYSIEIGQMIINVSVS